MHNQPVPMLDFARHYAVIREEVLAAITQVCDSQRYILGPEVASFEAAAAQACGVPHAIGCSSGTDALWLTLAALDIGPGDKVITSPFSFFASASAILRAGATPVFADIDERTFNLSPGAVHRAAAKHKLRAILPVHLYGQCADMAAFNDLAETHNLALIEDAAQAFGATWDLPDAPRSPAGAMSHAAAFSFYPTKNLAAFGDAGMVTTRSLATAVHVRSLHAHGMKVRYFHEEVGWNCRLDTLQAAVLEVKMKYVAAGNQRRRALAARYDQLFEAAGLTAIYGGEGVILPYIDPRAGHVFHQYVLRVPRRDQLRAFLSGRQIGTEIYYPLPLHLQQALKPLGYQPGQFPVAERAAAEVLALPMYPELRDDEQQIVVDTVREFYC